jgi:hypothetical protein
MRFLFVIEDRKDSGCGVTLFDETLVVDISVTGKDNIPDAIREFADKLKQQAVAIEAAYLNHQLEDTE